MKKRKQNTPYISYSILGKMPAGSASFDDCLYKSLEITVDKLLFYELWTFLRIPLNNKISNNLSSYIKHNMDI